MSKQKTLKVLLAVDGSPYSDAAVTPLSKKEKRRTRLLDHRLLVKIQSVR